MKTKRDSKPHQPQAANAASNKTETDTDPATTTELLNQALTLLRPMLEFLKPDKGMTMDDIKIRWDVRAVRGSGSMTFACLEGESTLHDLLALNMLMNSTERIEKEMLNKIVIPMVAIVQGVANRMALEIVAADDAARDLDDRSDDDLL